MLEFFIDFNSVVFLEELPLELLLSVSLSAINLNQLSTTPDKAPNFIISISPTDVINASMKMIFASTL